MEYFLAAADAVKGREVLGGMVRLARAASVVLVGAEQERAVVKRRFW